jgi:hypothetical protein
MQNTSRKRLVFCIFSGIVSSDRDLVLGIAKGRLDMYTRFPAKISPETKEVAITLVIIAVLSAVTIVVTKYTGEIADYIVSLLPSVQQ